ncbi:MAG: MCE family protein [Candidatus Omnitrophica bacterium]|nr:MCE family protein [Candidatus Omnitrophota bacterium]
MRFTNEIKTGLVVVVAIAIGIFYFGKTTSFRHKKYELKTHFVYAGNLKPDAIVKLSGIDVGRVKDMRFIYKDGTKVECLLEIDQAAKVRTDSIAYIDAAGFVGDAFVGITPGTEDNFVRPGAVLKSEDPVQMRLLMKKADQIANNLDSILADIKSVVSDNKDNLDNIIVNLEATSQNFKEFSENVKRNPWKLLFRQKED